MVGELMVEGMSLEADADNKCRESSLMSVRHFIALPALWTLRLSRSRRQAPAPNAAHPDFRSGS